MSKHEALHMYLFSYRTTPHCTTNCTPAELQMDRKLRTRLDALRYETKQKVELKQEQQKFNFTGNRKKEFSESDLVMAKEYKNNDWQWSEGKVIEKLGPVTYNVKTEDDRIWKRHVDQLTTRKENVVENKTVNINKDKDVSEKFEIEIDSNNKDQNELSIVSENEMPQMLRRSQRIRKAKQILDL